MLTSNQCVTIAGFGAFIVNPSNAKIDNTKNKISPPGVHVNFNKYILNNDGLIANALSDKENITNDEANATIATFVKEIKKQLKTNGVSVLPGVGVFFQSKNSALRFESDNKTSPKTFGLEEINIAPLPSAIKKRKKETDCYA